jgi:hypothetical protein
MTPSLNTSGRSRLAIWGLALGAAAFSLTLAGPAAAAGSLIVTPPLNALSGHSVRCEVGNASGSKDITVIVTMYSSTGNVEFGPSAPTTLSPHRSGFALVAGAGAHSCEVAVTKGGKKNARVSLVVRDALTVPLAAVNGY